MDTPLPDLDAVARKALTLPPPQRDALLIEAAGGNASRLAALHAAIERLASLMSSATIAPGSAASSSIHTDPTLVGIAETTAEGFEPAALFESAGWPGGSVGYSELEAAAHPTRVGAYRVLGVLGEGGMGVVYLAEQDRPRRTVALKLVRPDAMSAALFKRFELESQVLGRLSHPGIAAVYEAGLAPVEYAGRPPGPRTPYFAMEYVRGAPLTDALATAPLREKLAMVARVCDAVQHAHARGVIHRDLKPGNILVTDTGQPKVLDFGIARATDSDIRATTRTDAGQLVGTLPYMSPEQAAGDPAALDTRSDVYALGVILYELLSGRLPHDLSRMTIVEAARTIADAMPPTLSQLARAGSADRVLRGDISTIVAKAMQRDRDQRYQTASELAADLGRFLRGEPISARPPTAVYQLRMFARRNRVLVGLSGAACVLLILGIVGTSVGLARAVEQRREAQRQADIAREQTARAETERARADDEARAAKAINDFLVDKMLLAATPEEAQGRQITVSEVVGKAAQEIDSSFGDQPALRARLYDVMGKTYIALGEFEPAERFVSGAVDLRRAAAPGSRELGASLHTLGSLRFRQSRWSEALEFFNRAMTVWTARADSERESVETAVSIAACYRNLGRFAEAERAQRESLARAESTLGSDHAATLSSVANLAIVLHDQQKLDEAMRLYQRVVDARIRTLGGTHPSTLLAMTNLATAQYDSGDVAGAERTFTNALDVRRKVSGPDHPETLMDIQNLAVVREKLGRVEEAEGLYREALGIAVRKLGEHNESTGVLIGNLASNLARQKRDPEAEALFKRSIDALAASSGIDHQETIANRLAYGRFLLQRDRTDEAATIVEACVAALREKFAPEFPATVGACGTLALIREKQGRAADALPLAEFALEGRTRLLGPDHAATKDTAELVRRLREAR